MKRGMTLLEVLLSVGLSGVVLTVVTTLLSALWRADGRMRADLEARQSLARLELALREDIHAAKGALIDDRGSLTLEMSGEQATYSTEGPRVVRVLRSGDDVDHRDSFVLPRDSAAVFRLQQRTVQIVIEPAASAADAVPSLPVNIEAVFAPGREDQP